MLSDNQEQNNSPISEVQQLHLTGETEHLARNEKRDLVAGLEDKEYFLRKAFLRDEWEGCSLVFEYYYKPLCSHAVRFVHSKAYAEDIVSEVFLTFWHKRHFRQVNTTYRTYLFQAVRNRSLNFIRKEFGHDIELMGDESLLSRSIAPDKQMMYDQFYHKVQEGIDQLPPKCKKIFILSRFEDKPLKEIAMIHKISIRTVEAHISKALKIMREALNYTHD